MTLFQKDKLFLGALSGFMGDIVMDIFESGVQKAGFLNYTLDEYAGSLFLQNRHAITAFPGWLVGFLAGSALSMLLGIIFVYLIELSGFRGIITKGMIYGFLLWFLIFGGVASGLHMSYLRDTNPWHILFMLIAHLVFGLTLGIVIKKCGYPTIIKD